MQRLPLRIINEVISVKVRLKSVSNVTVREGVTHARIERMRVLDFYTVELLYIVTVQGKGYVLIRGLRVLCLSLCDVNFLPFILCVYLLCMCTFPTFILHLYSVCYLRLFSVFV